MRSEMTSTARAGLNQLFEFIENNNGGVDPRLEHNIEPQVARRIENALFADDGFLNDITLEMVDSPVGEVLSPETGKRLAKRSRSRTGSDAVLPNTKRRPTVLGNFNQRDTYFTLEMELDAMIPWRKLDRILRNKKAYQALMAFVRKQRRDDLITMMWNGQFSAEDTDLDMYPELQDLKRGFVQYAIDTAPEQVVGIKLDDLAPGGYTIDPIRLGPGAGDNGFETIAQLVHFLKNRVIHRNFRSKSTTKAYAGDDLILTDEAKLLGAGAAKPTEAVAAKLLMNTAQVGTYERKKCDHLPSHFLGLVNPEHLQHIVLENSIRARYDDQSQAHKGVISYYYKECDNAIAVPEHFAFVHPDAIELPTGYDADGKATGWAAADIEWKAELPGDLIAAPETTPNGSVVA